MEPITFAQIHAARLAHCQSTTVTNNQQKSVPLVTHRTDTVDTTGGILFQRCGGGRRVIRKRIGGN